MANRMRAARPRRWIGIVLAALAAAALAWWLVGRGGDGGDDVFRTAQVDRGPIRVVVAATGNLAAVSTVDIGSQVSGQIVDVQGDYNAHVAADQPIARIDPQPFQARLTQAQADLSSAKANLSSARAQLAEAEVVLRNAETTLRRTREVRERGLVSQADLDTAGLARDQAAARLDVARSAIEVAQANVAQRQAAVDSAQFDLERTVIRAPVDGVIVLRAVEPGQTVAASFQTPVLFQIAEDLSQMQIVLAIDEADVGQVKAGQPVRFNVDAFPDRNYQGVVREVRLAATNTANVITYPVVVAVDNADLSLLPGMTANAEIEISTRGDVLRVPNAAVRYRPPEGPAPMPGDATPQRRPAGAARGGALLAELTAKLSLDESQQQALRDAFQMAMTGGGAPAAGADPTARRAAMLDRIERAIGPTLSEQQRAAFDDFRRELQTQRMARLYVPEDGEAAPRNVRLGLTDGQYTEVAGGPLQEGDAVIVGIAAPAS